MSSEESATGPGDLDVAPRDGSWRRWRPAFLLLAGGVIGLLLALPQYVELSRILEWSYRGFQGFSEATQLHASWDPRRVLGWLLPFPFGEPVLTFWGRDFFGGDIPLFFSLYPGVLSLALVGVSGAPRAPVQRWSWLLVLGGIFLALGAHNPLMRALLQLPGGSLVRFPIKFWLPIAVGASCLVGVGVERLLHHDRLRTTLRVFGLLTLLYMVGSALLVSFPEGIAGWLRSHVPAGFSDSFVAGIHTRWLLLSLTNAGLALGYATILFVGRRRLAGATTLCLLLHALVQAWLLGPLLMTDETAVYRRTPALLSQVGPDETLVHGDYSELFGAPRLPEPYPDARLFWIQRRGAEQLYPFVGVAAKRRYELNVSAEGLDSFLSQVTLKAMNRLDDASRLRVLRALGVDLLLLGRPLQLDPSAGFRLRTEHRGAFGSIHLYEIEGSAPDVQLVGNVLRTANLNEALAIVRSPQFDPTSTVVLAGEGPPRFGAVGEVVVLTDEREEIVVRTSSDQPAVAVIHRSHLPIYKATVDGNEAPILVANMSHMAVEVPAGEHRVEIRVDRRPFWFSLLAWPVAVAVFILVTRLVARTLSPPGQRMSGAPECPDSEGGQVGVGVE